MSCAIDLRQCEIWFVTGTQQLYGPAALEKVAANAQEVATALGAAPSVPVKIVLRPVITSAIEATALCQQANNDPRCAGLITWCHTISPSKREVEVVRPDKPLPKLPVARAVWVCQPDLPTAAAAWIYAGSAHHTGFSPAVSTEMLEDFGEIAGLETVIIDAKTTAREFRKELRGNEVYYPLASGFVS
jgi:L-arabinose isomerase